MPRVIAGTAKGTRLETLAGDATRPTADRVKEALFSMLSQRIRGARFLDLYAGSGQIGIEAASRGASQVVCVEQSRASLVCLRRNLAKTQVGGIRVMGTHVIRALTTLARAEEEPFDLVYLDPPYQQATEALTMVSRTLSPRLLAHDALVILEHAATTEVPAFVTDLKLVRNCKYGMAMLSFYKENREDRGSSR